MKRGGETVLLDGNTLGVGDVGRIARGAHVTLDAAALARMDATNTHIQDAAATGKPVYGVTRGLGPKVVQALDAAQIDAFSRATVLGRAQSLGAALPADVVRAAMTIRINGLLTGASGAHPRVAEHVAACLNANLVPRIGAFGSVGAADLLWGGAMARALIGEGRFLGQPEGAAAAAALAAAGIAPLPLGPRDGLALVSHSSFSTAHAALAAERVSRCWTAAQIAAALTFEGFRGNLSPIRADVLALRPAPGQAESARDLRARLAGSHLEHPGVARRLQDPLSLRNTVQVHGSLWAAAQALEDTLAGELNGSSDNPVVLAATAEIVSAGGYLNPHLGVVLVGMNHALTHLASQSYARAIKLLFERFTGLPNGLAPDTANAAGLAPVTKAAEALLAEILHAAAPPMIYPAITADGVEDVLTHTAVAGKSALSIAEKLSYLIAIELVCAVHAITLRGDMERIAPGLRAVAGTLTGLSPPITADRSMTDELETIAALVRDGTLDAPQA